MAQPHKEQGQSNKKGSGDGSAHDEMQGFDGDLSGGNLDKIRAILFGAQMRDYDKRFARLDEHVGKEMKDIRDDMHRRFDSLETFIRKELESLNDRLKAEENERSVAARDLGNALKETTKSFTDKLRNEQNDRNDGHTALSNELQNTANTIDRRISQLDETMTKGHRELRDQLLEQSKSLSDEIRQKNGEVWAALGQAVEELRHEKTDRSALASLLTELALRLNDEFKIPSNE